MLILTRNVNETIKIVDSHTGTELTIMVTGIHTNRVRLGITAPAHIKITRQEAVQQTEAAPPETQSQTVAAPAKHTGRFFAKH